MCNPSVICSDQFVPSLVEDVMGFRKRCASNLPFCSRRHHQIPNFAILATTSSNSARLIRMKIVSTAHIVYTGIPIRKKRTNPNPHMNSVRNLAPSLSPRRICGNARISMITCNRYFKNCQKIYFKRLLSDYCSFSILSDH